MKKRCLFFVSVFLFFGSAYSMKNDDVKHGNHGLLRKVLHDKQMFSLLLKTIKTNMSNRSFYKDGKEYKAIETGLKILSRLECKDKTKKDDKALSYAVVMIAILGIDLEFVFGTRRDFENHRYVVGQD